MSRSFGCLPEGALTLVEAQRFSFGHLDEQGRIGDGIWTVTAQRVATTGVALQVYALRAMLVGTPESDQRYTKVITENLRRDASEQELWPLPVPVILLEPHDDAVTYVERKFLDADSPQEIEKIRIFLHPQSE